MPELDSLYRAKRQPAIPVILSVPEVKAILSHMQDTRRLMAELIYGTGLRIGECMTLRVKDIDFEQRVLVVRSGKGNKDRVTIIPERLTAPLQRHLLKVAQLHRADVLRGNGYVPMPNALYKKYPSASRSLAWQFVFPSSTVRPWQRTGNKARWHCSPSTLRKAIRRAVDDAQIHKHVGVRTLRHCFASHLLEAGTDIRSIQRLLGHKKLETTMIYTHVKLDIQDICSPLDRL